MKDTHFSIWRALPLGASVVLMILIAIVSWRTVREMNRAIYWREHTFQVVLDAQSLEDNLIDAQEGEEAYLQTGQPRLLLEYKHDTNAEMEELDELGRMTRDDPAQQARLKRLSMAVQSVFSNDSRIIGVYARQGPETALKEDAATAGWDVSDHALKDLENFTDEEKKLLAARDATEQADYHKAARLLIVGSVVAALLLVLANFVAGREISRRRAAELRQQELISELQKALAEVKTLSGLIPICSWCKNVRSDVGFWESVEQYLRARTDARFTHGICPKCSEKLDAEIATIAGKRKDFPS